MRIQARCSKAPCPPQFHYARALAWLAVLLRTLGTGDWAACAAIALGALASLLPTLASRLPRREHLRRGAWQGRRVAGSLARLCPSSC